MFKLMERGEMKGANYSDTVAIVWIV